MVLPDGFDAVEELYPVYTLRQLVVSFESAYRGFLR